jgi:hypothetical protein
MFWFAFGIPLTRVVAARGWDGVPCRVESAELHENSDSDGSTFRVDVRYGYTIGGLERVGDRYKFTRMSSSGRSGKLEAIEELRRNRARTCWVNPANPDESVMIRDLTADMLFGLIPLVFALVGAGGIWGVVLGRRSRVIDSVPLPDARPHATLSYGLDVATGRTVLKPITTRTVKFVAFLLFALFWNGIVSVFLYQLFTSLRAGAFEWFLALFLVPFVLVGVVVMVAAVVLGLQLANPRPVLEVSDGAIPLGAELKVRWTIDGAAHKLRGLRIELVGREEATYRRGTDSRTDREVFARIEVANDASPIREQGSAKVTIPADSMHSFDAPNNKIVWMVRVEGDIPNWPDSNDEFALTVLPQKR